jgi:hypothetical protein
MGLKVGTPGSTADDAPRSGWANSEELRAVHCRAAADVVRLIVIDLLGPDDGPESHVPWRLGQYAEHRPLACAAHVRWA